LGMFGKPLKIQENEIKIAAFVEWFIRRNICYVVKKAEFFEVGYSGDPVPAPIAHKLFKKCAIKIVRVR
jgi:hypothetical protein